MQAIRVLFIARPSVQPYALHTNEKISATTLR